MRWHFSTKARNSETTKRFYKESDQEMTQRTVLLIFTPFFFSPTVFSFSSTPSSLAQGHRLKCGACAVSWGGGGISSLDSVLDFEAGAHL